jgi:hypothetical protein
MKDYIFYAAGVKYYQLSNVINEIAEGQYLEMVKEPGNKFDKYAIELIYNSSILNEKVKIGYVPAKLSEEITHLLDEYLLVCEVEKVVIDNSSYGQLKLRVYVEPDYRDDYEDDELEED